MLTSWPRYAMSSFSEKESTSRPSNLISPSTMRPTFSNRRMTHLDITLFPEPDSPTTPRVSPLWSWKLTPSTALATPLARKK